MYEFGSLWSRSNMLDKRSPMSFAELLWHAVLQWLLVWKWNRRTDKWQFFWASVEPSGPLGIFIDQQQQCAEASCKHLFNIYECFRYCMSLQNMTIRGWLVSNESRDTLIMKVVWRGHRLQRGMLDCRLPALSLWFLVFRQSHVA